MANKWPGKNEESVKISFEYTAKISADVDKVASIEFIGTIVYRKKFVLFNESNFILHLK